MPTPSQDEGKSAVFWNWFSRVAGALSVVVAVALGDGIIRLTRLEASNQHMIRELDTIAPGIIRLTRLEASAEHMIRELDTIARQQRLLVDQAALIESRISIVESNRFTDRDALDMERRFEEKYPPEYLLDSVAELKSMLRAAQSERVGISERLAVVESRLPPHNE
jgi:hypothetical protein